MSLAFSQAMLPADAGDALLAGRLLLDDGPTPVLIRNGQVEDVSEDAPTVSHLLEADDFTAIRGRPRIMIGRAPIPTKPPTWATPAFTSGAR